MMKETHVKIMALIVVFTIGASVGLLAYRAVVTDFEFNDEVHSHIINAYWASTPELMMSEINLSMQGMMNLSLGPEMYGAYLPWHKTPDNSMVYCYAHLEAIMERCEEVILWRDSQDLTSGQVADVYGQKMTALHDFLHEGGWSDDIAYVAYYANYHELVHFWFPLLIIVLTVFLLGYVATYMILDLGV